MLLAALAPVPLLWFGPDVLGTGGALGASAAARGTASPQSAVYADVPGLEVLADFAVLLTPPVLIAAVAGAVVGGRTARLLAAAAPGWVLIVAVMTQAGYAGNPRYNVAAAAVGCVLAGVGVAGGGGARGVPLAVALLLAVSGSSTAGTICAIRRPSSAARRPARGARRGGAARRRRTGHPPLRPRAREPADEGDGRLAPRRAARRLADPPRAPAAVFQAPPGYAGELPTPSVPAGFPPRPRAGEWALRVSCAVRPAAARSGS